MSERAVEGAAGCGKTTRLMTMLAEALATTPLREGQRVLALTFMHGARRRLEERLRKVTGLSGRIECVVIDSFARRIVKRWRSLVSYLELSAIAEGDFNQVCSLASELLSHPHVLSWICQSYPIVLIDEAQDLSIERLQIVRSLAAESTVLVAADDYQCLNKDLRPSPVMSWFSEMRDREQLTTPHRTNVSALLKAALAIRSNKAPEPDGAFKIIPAQMYMAAACLASAIHYNRDQEIAILSPSMAAPFVQKTIERVCQTQCGKRKLGPFRIVLEDSDEDVTKKLTRALQISEVSTIAAARAALNSLPDEGIVRATLSWMGRQASCLGRTQFSRAEIEAIIAQQVTRRRQYGGATSGRWRAMTIHQAKNREFDGVVVLWPYQVGGDAEAKKRLLYNALTRAKHWCQVLVQGSTVPNSPPFV